MKLVIQSPFAEYNLELKEFSILMVFKKENSSLIYIFQSVEWYRRNGSTYKIEKSSKYRISPDQKLLTILFINGDDQGESLYLTIKDFKLTIR